jgi:hypothetical protein
MKRITTRTRFPFYLWYWTADHEDLFDLDDAGLAFFQLLVKEANL